MIGYRWDGTRCRLFFRMVPDSYNDAKLIDFIIQLRKEFRHKRLLLLWDGLPSNRSRQMTAYLEDPRKWLSVVRLPAYAPELNAVESVGSNIQGKELANLCAEDLGRKIAGVRVGFIRIHSHKRLPYSFLKHVGLSFDRNVS